MKLTLIFHPHKMDITPVAQTHRWTWLDVCYVLVRTVRGIDTRGHGMFPRRAVYSNKHA